MKVLRYCAVTNSIKIWKIFESIADKCILTYDFISDRSSREIDQKKFNPTDVYAITRNVLGASYASWDNVPTQEIEEDRRGLITNDEDEAITEIENTLPVRPVVSNHINDILNTLMSGRSNFMQNMHNTIFNNSGHSNLHPGDATIHDQLNIITETKDVLLFAKDQKQIISSDLAKTTQNRRRLIHQFGRIEVDQDSIIKLVICAIQYIIYPRIINIITRSIISTYYRSMMNYS